MSIYDMLLLLNDINKYVDIRQAVLKIEKRSWLDYCAQHLNDLLRARNRAINRFYEEPYVNAVDLAIHTCAKTGDVNACP